MRVACDLEGDSLYPSRLWCIVCEDLDSPLVKQFYGENMVRDFLAFAEGVTLWVGHNFLSYDRPSIARLLGYFIPRTKIEDTLILSRLLYTGLIHSHALEYWGKQMGVEKPKHEDWSQFSPEMLHRCTEDTKITKKLWWKFQEPLRNYSRKCVELEHQTQELLDKQRSNGFYLDIDKAQGIYQECKGKADEIERSIKVLFPPRQVLVETYNPKKTKAGVYSTAAQGKLDRWPLKRQLANGHWELYEEVEFNIASPMQVVERLNETGWKPIIKTDKGTPKLCEENLETIPTNAPPAIRQLSKWLIYNNRCKVLEGWFDAYNPETRCIHGTTLCIGAITHRMAHREPQMANIPAVRSEYGYELRSCLGVADPTKYSVVGTDIGGIQLCILAHYLDDPAYTKAIVEGKKENNTDVHSVNRDILKEVAERTDRDVAKTFIYAMLLGAGDWKLGTILGFPSNSAASAGRAAKDLLFRRIPAFRRVQEMCRVAARRGYMLGIDGRRTPIKSEHFALSAYLQCGEAVVMKQAIVLVDERAKHLDWAQMACVHDELQSRVLNEQAHELGKLQVQAIVDSGVIFGLRCPLNGEYKVGKTWADTH